jgi:transcriptional regulator with XRE-family HTH domain
MESGRNTPTLPTIEKAAAAVGVSPADLLAAEKRSPKRLVAS